MQVISRLGGRAGGVLRWSKAADETRYKLFPHESIRNVVLARLETELVGQGFCPADTKAQLCLAAGNIHGDPAPLRAIFAAKGWRLFERSWFVGGLEALATESYENSVASVVAKLLLREPPSARNTTATATDSDDDERVPPTRVSGYSTRPGFTNANGQSVVRPTDLPGTGFGQKIYVLRCGRCSEEDGANGSDIWLRKCPKCQGGRLGLAF